MKGIVLAGGSATRLYPSTISISKQILPVYDKPMIYYPISVLMLAGIRDILIISTPRDIEFFKNLLGDGSQFGIKFSYKIQPEPKGLAQAFIIAEDFIQNESVAMILGDNIFYGPKFSLSLANARKCAQNGIASIFAYFVKNPNRFGVVEFDENSKAISLEEKPLVPKSNYAITGLYFYDNKVVEYAKQIKPSKRGELEITDLNNIYLKNNKLNVEILTRGFAWLDTGTPESLIKAALYVQTIEDNQGVKIACLEEVALRCGFITQNDLDNYLSKIKVKNEYYEYISNLML
ncbi:glucose-1-phosphate thymidylyltransferase RfbA [bacterium]|nr:glucose-1-phosphate thymidylyltransferase RfbA [bacterium]